MMVFIVGGYDTTGYTVEWIITEVAKKDEVFRKIKQEIDDRIPSDTENISYSQANSLSYLDMVIKEGMRLRPVGGIQSTISITNTNSFTINRFRSFEETGV